MLKEAQTLQNSFQVLSSTYSDFLKQPPSLIQIKQLKTSHIHMNVCMVKIIKSIYKYLKFQLCCEILIFMCWISNTNIYVLSIEYHSTMNICSILHPVLRASAKIFAFFVEKLLSCCVGNKRRWCDEVEIIDKKHSNCEFLPE